MTAVHELPLLPEDYTTEPEKQLLGSLQAMEDPGEQIWWLRRGAGFTHPSLHKSNETAQDPAYNAEALANVAADPNSPLLLSVRIQALERAIELGYGQDTGMPVPSEDFSIRSDAQNVPSDGHFTSPGHAYRYVAETLLESEHIPRAVMFPPWGEAEIDRGSSDDYNPYRSYMFLNEVQKNLHEAQPAYEAQRFEPLLQGVQNVMRHDNNLPESADIPLDTWKLAQTCARLVRKEPHYTAILSEVIGSRDKSVLETLRTIGEMANGAANYASQAYPERYRKQVYNGLELSLSDAMFALLDHVEHANHTDTAITLRGGRELPLKLEAGEPLLLMQKLQQAMQAISRIKGYGDVGTVRTNQGDGYGVYRFVSYAPHNDRFRRPELSPNGVVAYIRERGDVTYDETLEYGRPGEGVEASIGYVVDLDAQSGMAHVGKRRASVQVEDDQRISIRLDREGVAWDKRNSDVKRDPTQQHGTLSLDVGSVLGKDEWTSTKLGRFLAHGNALRAKAMGVEAHLNHVTDYFSPEDGDAEVFASQAAALRERLEGMRLSREDIAAFMTGVVRSAGK